MLEHHLSIQPRSSRAVTLIEMMLVVALIGVLSVGSIQALRTQAENAKVQTLVEQIQHMAIAARAYYANKGEWPIDETVLSSAANNLTYRLYNPWGLRLNMGRDTVNTHRAGIVATVPSERVARKVANKLPLTGYQTILGTHAVRMELTLPSDIAWAEALNKMPIIKGMTQMTIPLSEQQPDGSVYGIPSSDKQLQSDSFLVNVSASNRTLNLPAPTCSGGYTPKTAVGFLSVERHTSTEDGISLATLAICRHDSNDELCHLHKPSAPNQVNIKMGGYHMDISAKARLLIIDLCEPT